MHTADARPTARAGTDSLSLTFGALADPTRRAILARLSSGDLSVSEIAAPFHMSLPAVSKHLRVLERAKLISRGRDAQFRPCHLTAAPLLEVMEFARAYERFWSQKMDSLSDYLASLQKQQAPAEDTDSAGSSSRVSNVGPKGRRAPSSRKKGKHGDAKHPKHD
jgi:DNA-binding transcriptional ArsR family regulator